MIQATEYSERELRVINLALIYAREFHRDTAIDNGQMLIAKMALHLGFELDANLQLLLPPTVKQAPALKMTGQSE